VPDANHAGDAEASQVDVLHLAMRGLTNEIGQLTRRMEAVESGLALVGERLTRLEVLSDGIHRLANAMQGLTLELELARVRGAKADGT